MREKLPKGPKEAALTAALYHSWAVQRGRPQFTQISALW